MHAVPRFLWNAKMRFGKTFTSYQLAKKLGAKRVLVVTFKPAVEDAWQTDLESHVDFDGWQYLSAQFRRRPDPKMPKKRRWSILARFRICWAGTRQGTSRPRMNGCTNELGPCGVRRIPFRRLARDREGTVRGRGRGGRTTETKLEYAAGLERVNEDLGGFRRTRPTSCRSRRAPISIYPARRSTRWRPASSSKSRFSTGPIPTNSAPRRSSPRRIPASGIPTARCRRCAC